MKQYVVFLARVLHTPSSAHWDDTLSPFLRLIPPVIHIWLLVASCCFQYAKGRAGSISMLSCMWGLYVHATDRKCIHLHDQWGKKTFCLESFENAGSGCWSLVSHMVGNSLTICSRVQWIVFTIWFEVASKLPMHRIMVSDVFQRSFETELSCSIHFFFYFPDKEVLNEQAWVSLISAFAQNKPSSSEIHLSSHSCTLITFWIQIKKKKVLLSLQSINATIAVII